MSKFPQLLALLLLASWGCLAQESDTADAPSALPGEGRNELKVNMLYFIAELPEITYERLLSEDAAFGLSVGFAIDSDIEYKLGVIPYYRFYFGKGYAQGFFLEANTFFGSVDDYFYDFDDLSGQSGAQFAFGVGVAAGAKFLTRKNWIGEIYFGVGRFFNDDLELEAYPRVGIVFGKRFR